MYDDFILKNTIDIVVYIKPFSLFVYKKKLSGLRVNLFDSEYVVWYLNGPTHHAHSKGYATFNNRGDGGCCFLSITEIIILSALYKWTICSTLRPFNIIQCTVYDSQHASRVKASQQQTLVQCCFNVSPAS